MFWDNFWDILLPRFCLGCGREGRYICRDCQTFLGEVENTLPGLVSVWEYEGLMEKLIWEIKYHGKYHIIEELVEKTLDRIELELPVDTYISYVPMWPKRERERGFNQSELIAHKLGRLLGLAEQPLLEKVRDNKSQVGLSPKEREENVKGAFQVKSQIPNSKLGVPENVLLVDDVYTTGATVRECIRVLRKDGVKNVWAFTLARKLRI